MHYERKFVSSMTHDSFLLARIDRPHHKKKICANVAEPLKHASMTSYVKHFYLQPRTEAHFTDVVILRQ